MGSITVWLTGLSGAGKTAVGKHLARIAGAVLLDGDELRVGLCSDLGFSIGDRAENVRRAASVARVLNAQGFNVVVALISPSEDGRRAAAEIVGDAMRLVYVSTPLEVCAGRDPKGLYARAYAGDLLGMTGVGARWSGGPYEIPRSADAVIDTSTMSVSTAAADLLRKFFIDGR